MKLFLVSANSAGYDEFDAFVVAAENEQQVREGLEKPSILKAYDNDSCTPSFGPSQGPIAIKEIKVEDCKPLTVILSSYNAG